MIDFHWATVVDCVEYEHVKVDADLWLTDQHRIRFNSCRRTTSYVGRGTA